VGEKFNLISEVYRVCGDERQALLIAFTVAAGECEDTPSTTVEGFKESVTF